jgi:hypothetical protein
MPRSRDVRLARFPADTADFRPSSFAVFLTTAFDHRFLAMLLAASGANRFLIRCLEEINNESP